MCIYLNVIYSVSNFLDNKFTEYISKRIEEKK